jgi:hypothetical protein
MSRTLRDDAIAWLKAAPFVENLGCNARLSLGLPVSAVLVLNGDPDRFTLFDLVSFLLPIRLA